MNLGCKYFMFSSILLMFILCGDSVGQVDQTVVFDIESSFVGYFLLDSSQKITIIINI